jgi:hypothetical protein
VTGTVAVSGIVANTRELLLNGRLSTVDLLIKIGCFVKMEKHSSSMKSSLGKLVRTRRLTVLILPLL